MPFSRPAIWLRLRGVWFSRLVTAQSKLPSRFPGPDCAVMSRTIWLVVTWRPRRFKLIGPNTRWRIGHCPEATRGALVNDARIVPVAVCTTATPLATRPVPVEVTWLIFTAVTVPATALPAGSGEFKGIKPDPGGGAADAGGVSRAKAKPQSKSTSTRLRAFILVSIMFEGLLLS